MAENHNAHDIVATNKLPLSTTVPSNHDSVATNGYVIQNAGNGHDVNQNNNHEDVDLRHEYRHIFRVMTVFGLYHKPRIWRKMDNTGSWGDTLQILYCLFVQIIMYLNSAKTAVGLWYLKDNAFAMQITVCVWYLLCVVNVTILYHICSTDKLPTIFNFWQAHCQSSSMSRNFGTSVDALCIRPRQFGIFGIAVCFTVSNSIFSGFARFGPITALRNDTYFMVAPTTEPVLVWDIVCVVSIVYASAAFLFPSVVLLTPCSIIGYQFHKFTDKFSKCISTESRFRGCLIALRRQHQYLSKVVFVIDDAFSFYLAINFGSLIVIGCFMMYELVVANSSVSPLTVLLFWLGTVSIKFRLLGIIVAQVHDKAHEISNHIHNIGVFGFKEHEEVTQMTMLMAKLNGPAIALTLWGIVPLTKEFLMTVVGVYITYFALVAQSF